MTTVSLSSETTKKGPVRVLVLRGVDGAGGGADEIILRSATSIDSRRIQMRLCFFRHVHDQEFTFEDRARNLSLDYCDVKHRGPFDRSVLSQLQRIVREFEPDVVHSHDYKANFYSRIALSRRPNVKRVATAHGWTGNGLVERYLYYPAERRILRSFDRVIAVSDDIRQTLVRSGVSPHKISVVLNGIDSSQYVASPETRESTRSRLGFSASDFVIGGVGRLESQKRFDLLLIAFQAVLQRCPQARLVIAGEGSLKSMLHSQINELGLSTTCRLLGHCGNMREVYQAFDVLVQSSDYEGTPTVIVEAMALGVPIVATDAGGTSQLAYRGEHALIVPCRDTRSLADAIIETRQNADQTTKRVNAAQHRARTKLTFQARVEKLMHFYETL